MSAAADVRRGRPAAGVVDRSVRHVAAMVLARDFPALPLDRLDETTSFVARRIGQLGGPVRLGVHLMAVVLRGLAGLPVIGRPGVDLLARRPLPLLGDYVRLIRSLGYAFVWERWPDTRVDGAVTAWPVAS